MSTREIPKKPQTPELTFEKIELLTSLCFRNDDQEIPKVDLIFVFGSAICFSEMKEAILKVIHQSDCLLLTGGIEKYVDSSVHDLPESLMLYETVKDELPKNVKVICEEKSRNTYENLDFGLKLLKANPKSVCFIAKSFHAGRAYLTLRKFLPDAKIYQRTFNPSYAEPCALTREDWWKNKEYSARVYGEFLRIKKYGSRNDLLLDEVKEWIAGI